MKETGIASTGKLKFITYLYGIATILVVFGHSHPLHGSYPNFLIEITNFIYTFHMPLFFLIAGMLIQRSSDNRDIWKWWIGKVKRLILPYVVLSLIAFVPKVLISSVISDDMTLSVANIIRILLVPRANVWGHFWFIPVYLVLSLIGALITKFVVKRSKIAVGGVLFVSIVLNLFPVNVSWLGIKDITEMLFYVVLGILLYVFIKKKTLSIFVIRISSIFVVVSVLLYVFFRNIYINKLICLLMLYAMISIAVWLQSYEIRFLSVVGNKAFTIFVYSWPIQAVLELLILVVLKLNWYISYPVMFVGGLIGPLVLYQLYYKLIRPHMKHTGFLDGMIGVRS